MSRAIVPWMRSASRRVRDRALTGGLVVGGALVFFLLIMALNVVPALRRSNRARPSASFVGQMTARANAALMSARSPVLTSTSQPFARPDQGVSFESSHPL